MTAIQREIIEKLKSSVPFFSGFGDIEIVNLLKVMQREFYQDGQTIFDERSEGKKMFVILSGKVKIAKKMGRVSKSEEIMLADFSPGECFGEMGLIDNSPRSARAFAEGPVTLLSLTDEMLMKIAQNSNYSLISMKLFRNFARILARRLREADEKLVDLSQRLD